MEAILVVGLGGGILVGLLVWAWVKRTTDDVMVMCMRHKEEKADRWLHDRQEEEFLRRIAEAQERKAKRG